MLSHYQSRGTYNTLFLGYAQLILVFCQIFQAAGNFWNSQVRCADNCDSAELTQFMGKQNSNKIFLFCLRSVVALVVVMISTATEFPIEIFHSCWKLLSLIELSNVGIVSNIWVNWKFRHGQSPQGGGTRRGTSPSATCRDCSRSGQLPLSAWRFWLIALNPEGLLRCGGGLAIRRCCRWAEVRSTLVVVCRRSIRFDPREQSSSISLYTPSTL